VVALEAGWVTTEVGRQPWIVHEVMRVEEAVTDTSWIPVSLAVVVVIYTALTVIAVKVLRSMARRWRDGADPDLPTPYGALAERR
jgi:cytochrome d ubiquinol oxidase subunit I